MKKIVSWKFLATLIISFLAFEGLESLIHEWFSVDLHSLLAFGGMGTILILGFKFHIFCCVLPTLFATLACTNRGRHCSCDLEHEHEQSSSEVKSEWRGLFW